jgi:alpha-galactosidase
MTAEIRAATGAVLARVVDEAIAGAVAERGFVPMGSAWEATLRLTGTDLQATRIERLDALVLELGPHEWTAGSFSSGWGAEFEPVAHAGIHGLEVGVRSGRSSHGAHPLLVLESAAAVLMVSVAWSGNWRISIDEQGVLRAGVNPHDFFLDLPHGQSVDAPSVLVATGPTVAEAGAALSRAVGKIIPRTVWSEAMPTEWNHWWPYEDAEITADAFLAESALAADAGLEVATLDAGWFGRPDLDADWQAERGDWVTENRARFPDGLSALADDVRDLGVDFGVWIEPEALGAAAAARRRHPGIIATRSQPDGAPRITVSLDEHDPTFLGYVCLGSPEGRRFAAAAMDDLVGRTGARWLKLDFNVDPGSGCDREDHGHGRGDGLFRHYEGLYAVLDEFRARHPDVVLESCSSGGLRLDIGLARHVHCHFLSDPDWTEHHLQVLWGASLMLPPAAILHWTWSQWRGDHPSQRRDLATLPDAAFDRALRAAMLHRWGVSLRLTELPERLRDRLAAHVTAFRTHVAPLLSGGTLTAMTAQPLRDGRGCRVPAFQLDSGNAHLRAMFALDRLDHEVVMRFDGLDDEEQYEVTPLADDDAPFTATGEQLRRGFARRGASWLWLARRVDPSR